MAHAYNPNYLGDWDQEDSGSRSAQTNSSQDPYLQNNQGKMNWRYSSSSRVPALQAWSLEFKPQSHQKKNVIMTSCISLRSLDITELLKCFRKPIFKAAVLFQFQLSWIHLLHLHILCGIVCLSQIFLCNFIRSCFSSSLPFLSCPKFSLFVCFGYFLFWS
jgi:hypothetical protein